LSDQAPAPVFHQGGIVLIDADQIALDEGHVAAGFDQQVCEVIGFQPAAFGQGLAAFGGQAFDAGFDGDAAGLAQQAQHVRLPQVDRVWTPNTTFR